MTSKYQPVLSTYTRTKASATGTVVTAAVATAGLVWVAAATRPEAGAGRAVASVVHANANASNAGNLTQNTSHATLTQGDVSRRGLILGVGATDVELAPLDGLFSYSYDYNVMLMSDSSVSFVRRQPQFVPEFSHILMTGGAYVQLEMATPLTGWPLPGTGSNRRCYFLGQNPTNPNNEYFNSPNCTLEMIIPVVNATIELVKPARVEFWMSFNEPWSSAMYPEDPIESAHVHKDFYEPIARLFGLRLISATSIDKDKALSWDVTFFTECARIGCDLDSDLFVTHSIHRYNSKESVYANGFEFPAGRWYQDRVAAFAAGAGGKSGDYWRDFWLRPSRKFIFTEINAEQEKETSYGAPDAEGTCLRFSGQFGNPSTCGSTPACAWGGGPLAFLENRSNANVHSYFIWPTRYDDEGGNQAGARSARLVDAQGRLTPMGRLMSLPPSKRMEVDCTENRMPSPPPPVSGPPPPSLPPAAGGSAPPSTPPQEFTCADRNGRTNAQVYWANGRWCTDLSVSSGSNCQLYYTQTLNGNTRFCTNSGGVDGKCGQSSMLSCTNYFPPSPPPVV